MSSRPSIPIDIQRDLMVECGHRCCVCGENLSLEKAHIIAWSVTKDHSFENLLVLCSLCHTRSHDEAWDEKTLRKFKEKPWVTRYKGVPENVGSRKVVTLKLDTTLDAFEGDKDRVLAALAAVIDASPKDVYTLSIEQGSVLLTASIPADAATRILLSPEAHTELRELLKPIRLISITSDGEAEDARKRVDKMYSFNESNTVEAFIRDRLAGSDAPTTVTPGLARKGSAISGLGWHFVGPANLPRKSQEALVEPYLRDALIRLNPDIAANPSRVDDVLYPNRTTGHDLSLKLLARSTSRSCLTPD